ncbi:DUF2793 domain-containing protein [Maritimibacter sp. UBA3975]|uniref:DUF2793 domain-containing protein n=1 Tax=Maritimibacter sp. UBA3975 TaxID=1946833 RepID=UPI000C0ABE5E|nr:DUF2793 domain-containing protein [Maritimibacter sp. UBA3975]MAM63386.1 hypothetical protein [Maritimibacter sp.]|tara:strand:- start:94010 stop:94993 length:984 start_codon:yes stop_codon:yes gene_type:complete
MTQASPRLTLPFIQPAQAQKHVTHNEALRLLDTVVQLSLDTMGATTPPASPGNGDTHAIGSGATGDWAGHDGEIATWLDAAWYFQIPKAGWLATIAGGTDVYVHDGSDWTLATASVDLDNVSGLGVNTASDTTNRLAVSAPATLLSHEGSGHQLKINKAGLSDTASLLFQTNWSGRAEMGLAGNDRFSIKVSGDGSAWDEALNIGPGEGIVTTETMVGTVSATPGVGSAVIEEGSGVNGSFTKFADGTLICSTGSFATLSGAAATWTLPEAFTNTDFTVTATVIGSTPAVATISARTTSTVTIESFDLSGSDTATPAVTLMAVGRWF